MYDRLYYWRRKNGVNKFIVVFLVGLAVVMLGCAGEEPTKVEKSPTHTTTKEENKGMKKYLNITYLELLNLIYDKNLTKLQREQLFEKYKGKYLVIVGQVEDVSRDGRYIRVYTGPFRAIIVKIELRPGEETKLKNYYVGDNITLIARIVDYAKSELCQFIELNDGRVVSADQMEGIMDIIARYQKEAQDVHLEEI